MAAPPPRPSAAALADARALGLCPHCGRAVPGQPNKCPHCGRLLGDAADDLKRVAAEQRALLGRRKTIADVLFLAGLLLGGPLVSRAGQTAAALLAPLGGHIRVGLFVLLAGAAASALCRWTQSSPLAALLIGGLAAAVVAVAVTNPAAVDAAEQEQVGENARSAYIAALTPDIEAGGGLAEARGPGSVVAWFQVPGDMVSLCGDFPPADVRTHMAGLGFERIVVGGVRADGTVCSFRP